MAVMRSALLWASENDWLAEHVPRRRFVKRALRRFMPGERLEDAITAAAGLADRGIPTTFTHLGENVTDLAAANAATEEYLAAYDEIERSGLDVEISVKLTHLGLDIDAGRTADNVTRLAARAAAAGNWLWIDIESYPYVDRTLEQYVAVRSDHDNVGLCIQAYLHRTPDDIAALLPLRPGIRLVKGAYKEPPEVALTKRSEITERFIDIAADLIEPARAGQVRLAMATHDLEMLARLDQRTGGGDAYEIQMLYGIRAADQFRLAAEGREVRTLISYGDHWYPWYVRRLAEKPANLGFVVRNVFGGGPSH